MKKYHLFVVSTTLMTFVVQAIAPKYKWKFKRKQIQSKKYGHSGAKCTLQNKHNEKERFEQQLSIVCHETKNESLLGYTE